MRQLRDLAVDLVVKTIDRLEPEVAWGPWCAADFGLGPTIPGFEIMPGDAA
jgi:hypothetical protein